MNILVIDKDKFLAENLCSYLKQNPQSQIHYLSTLNEVYANISKNKYYLISTELFMPGGKDENWLLKI